ncbi:MAG: transcription-repair coupling factor [Candidatus Aminicenantales bacterium]
MSLDFLEKNELFRRLLDNLRRNEKEIRIAGPIGPAVPYFLTVLSQALERSIVLVQPRARSLSRLEEGCRFYFSQFSLSTGLETLPELTESPYDGIPPSLEAVSSRMKFFFSLGRRSPSLVLTNLFGLLKPVPGPENLKALFLEIEVGQERHRDRLLQTLRDFGYAKEELIASPGEYAWRGGIVDVFSPWGKDPFRLEFSGDEVASIREFDSSTQRSLARVTRVLVPSLREFPGSADFLEGWAETAAAAAFLPGRDRRRKKDSLLKGEVPPDFAYLALLEKSRFVPFSHHLKDAVFIIADPDEVEKEWNETRETLDAQYQELCQGNGFSLPPEDIYPSALWEDLRRNAAFLGELLPQEGKNTYSFPFQSVPRFDNKIPFFIKYMKRLQRTRERCAIFLSNPMVRQKVAALLSQNKVKAREEINPFAEPQAAEILLLLGDLERGWSFSPERITIFSERDVFTEEKVLVSRPARRAFVSHFQDLRESDHVVHADYGIGIFRGLIRLEVDGQDREFIEISYQDEDRLYVPVEDLNLVQKYSQLGTTFAPLDKLGTGTWQKTKERTKKAIEKMARELLELYARRKALQGFSFSPSGAWASEFEKTFEYDETEDQLRTIKEVVRDMESDSPMDRLVCGDVGYGKTEVAMRAAFKAVMDGKQVAVLCPTTVLASQHLHTFRNRLVLFPVRMEALSRLQTRTQQTKTVEDTKKGRVDILIGTHRLLSPDVEFLDLGLLIVDEEQRFGVSHKEKIKKMKANIDVLTLTATPIPRTLNLSLSGLRDISLIETPPKDRLAIHTVVAPFQSHLAAAAIRQELNRQGQVYYVHNRIEDIEEIAGMVTKLIPQARVASIHGRMPPAAVEKRMLEFVNGRSNVLISTTIIENGIDIPLVNTLIVDRADLFGLSQLYQLRGRVGRSSRQAYAYFLVPPFTELTSLAKERLKALKEFSDLGSGFRLAAKDLEIRGAGNLLGSQQHGTMEAVGFDYFMELLDQTIKELKGEKAEDLKSELNLRVDIRIPEDYIPQINLRLNLYKRVSSVESPEEVEKIRGEVRDRFGPLPGSVENLLRYGAIKHLAQKIKIRAIDRVGSRLILKFHPSTLADLSGLTRVLKKSRGSLTPQGVLALPLAGQTDPAVLDETASVLKELYGYNRIN